MHSKKLKKPLAARKGDNALVLLGAFSKQAEREGWTNGEISLVLAKAKDGDYTHLTTTLSAHCECPIESLTDDDDCDRDSDE